MKTLQRLLAPSVVLVAAFAFFATPAEAVNVVVKTITIQFDTLDGGKAPLAAVSVMLQNGTGVIAASYEFAKGPLAANSTSPEFMLPATHGPVSTDDLRNFKVTVQLQAPPGKTATWRFKYNVTFRLANGAVITRPSAPCELKSNSGGIASLPREYHL
jgi:hypothetical protein